MLISRRVWKNIAVGTIGLGTLASLRANEYDVGAIGIVRLGRAAVTVFLIGNHYQNNLYKTSTIRGTPEYEAIKSKAHQFGAQKLLELCCANKGVYIKVGQHIGALDYLLPPEYVTKMRILHSAAPQSPFKDVLAVIKEDFKQDAYEIFNSIETDPLGAASLAQVHKATLKDGSSVAVKVQHRSVKANSYVDIKTMSALVKITSWIFPDFTFDWLVEETKKNLPRELDFTQEGRNAEKLEKMFKQYQWLKVPKIYWDISSPRVLTMEFVDGGQINDVSYLRKNGFNFYEVSNKLGRLYSHMIFITGFVHADPHPGNILVRKKGSEAEIVLLDHGLYADLTNEFRWEYSKLWLAILDRDKEAMKTHCEKLGVGDFYALFSCMVSGRTWDTIVHGVRKKKYSSTEKELFQKEIPNLLPQISHVLQKVDRQMLLILKTNDLIRSIEYTLNTQSRMTAFLEMSSCCVHSVYGEKLKFCQTNLSKWKLRISEQWTIFKLALYYVYLGVLNFNILQSVESLKNNDFYPM